LCRLHAELGDAYAAVFSRAGDELADGAADLAVLHGQTFYHWVDESGRALGILQLGDASRVPERLSLLVVSDLRSRDVAAGGQGAPLVSMFDSLVLASSVRGLRCSVGAAGTSGGHSPPAGPVSRSGRAATASSPSLPAMSAPPVTGLDVTPLRHNLASGSLFTTTPALARRLVAGK
jgi:1,6-anhydro-N-acetylmuramate kinase